MLSAFPRFPDQPKISCGRFRFPFFADTRRHIRKSFVGRGLVPIQNRKLKQRSVIPVVRVSRRNLALNGVSNNRNHLVAAIVRWILQFHQRSGVDSRGKRPASLSRIPLDTLQWPSG